MSEPIKYLDLKGLKALYGVVDGKIQGEKDRALAAEQKLSDAIAAMDLEAGAETGKFITAVHQTDGKVTVERGGVSASMVTAVPVTGDDTVAITGATVEDQIKNLGQTLKTVEGNAAKYKVVKLSDADVKGLSDGANVREAYKVVSWTGDEATAHPTQVGEIIKIYKDAALLSVTTEDGPVGENTVIKFTYSLADGAQEVVSVDLGKAIFESEMGNGMQVVDNKIAIKLDAANDGDFLTVSANGLKLSGVKEAIKTAVDEKNVSAQGDDYIHATAEGNKVIVSANVEGLTVTPHEGAESTIAGVEKSLVDGKEVADKVASFTNARISEEIAKLDATVGETTVAGGNHVAVQVVEADGIITAVNVTESGIASQTALEAEVARATGAEAKALTDAKAYTDGEFRTRTTIAGYGITDAKIVDQTITLGTAQLQFVAWTPEEIQAAAGQ